MVEDVGIEPRTTSRIVNVQTDISRLPGSSSKDKAFLPIHSHLYIHQAEIRVITETLVGIFATMSPAE